jgi:hypothetical protein
MNSGVLKTSFMNVGSVTELKKHDASVIKQI